MCAGNVAAASALITDATPEEDRSRGMAIIGISFGLGFTIGPAVGAGLAALPAAFPDLLWEGPGILGTGLPFAAAGIMALSTALLGSVVLVETDVEGTDAGRTSLRDRLSALREHPHGRSIAAMCGLFFAYTTASSILEVTFFPYAEEVYGFEAPQIGLIFAGMGLILVVVQGSVGRISDRIGDRRMTACGLAAMAVGLGLAPVEPLLAFLLACLGIATVGRGLAHTGILSLTSSLARESSEAGKIMGLLQSSSSLGRIAGPALGGVVFDYIAVSAPFVASAAIVAVAGVGWWAVFQLPGRSLP
jgi:MFS family permease